MEPVSISRQSIYPCVFVVNYQGKFLAMKTMQRLRDIFAQCYALAVVHATVALVWVITVALQGLKVKVINYDHG